MAKNRGQVLPCPHFSFSGHLAFVKANLDNDTFKMLSGCSHMFDKRFYTWYKDSRVTQF